MGKPPANTAVRFWRDPDLPGIELRYSSYNEEAFREHTHDAFSVVLMETGRTTFALEALAAGVGVRFIVDLEAGKPTVRLENVLRVLQALGITLAASGLDDISEEPGVRA